MYTLYFHFYISWGILIMLFKSSILLNFCVFDMFLKIMCYDTICLSSYRQYCWTQSLCLLLMFNGPKLSWISVSLKHSSMKPGQGWAGSVGLGASQWHTCKQQATKGERVHVTKITQPLSHACCSACFLCLPGDSYSVCTSFSVLKRMYILTKVYIQWVIANF